MTKLDYPDYHRYVIWRTDLENEDEEDVEEYFKTVWESEKWIVAYVEMLNEGSNRYEYHYYVE